MKTQHLSERRKDTPYIPPCILQGEDKASFAPSNPTCDRAKDSGFGTVIGVTCATSLANRRGHWTSAPISRWSLALVGCFFFLMAIAQELPIGPPMPPVMAPITNGHRANIIMTAATTSLITNPVGFMIVDQRFSNYFGSVSFKWTPNIEADLAGYFFYHGPRPGFYTNMIQLEAFADRFTLEKVSRTNRNYFALSAFSTSGLESDRTKPDLVWPEPPMPAYTNYLAILEFQMSTNLVDWETTLTISNYFTPMVAPVFYRARMNIMRWP